MTSELTGKTAIVTGANSGIGFETALALVSRGARVILACRNEASGIQARERILKAFPSGDARFFMLELGDLQSIRSFAEKFHQTQFALHILCNNAGIMMCPRGNTVDGFETQFGINHLGHFALTGLLLGSLRQTPGARVITVSSTYHRKGRIDFDNLNAETSYNKNRAYYQSKLANLLFAYELQRRFETHSINAISLAAHPGYCATNIQRHMPVFRLTNHFFAQPPSAGALPTVYAASEPNVKGGEYFGPNGLFEMKGLPTRVRSSPASHDLGVAKRLWEVSERLTGIRFN